MRKETPICTTSSRRSWNSCEEAGTTARLLMHRSVPWFRGGHPEPSITMTCSQLSPPHGSESHCPPGKICYFLGFSGSPISRMEQTLGYMTYRQVCSPLSQVLDVTMSPVQSCHPDFNICQSGLAKHCSLELAHPVCPESKLSSGSSMGTPSARTYRCELSNSKIGCRNSLARW